MRSYCLSQPLPVALLLLLCHNFGSSHSAAPQPQPLTYAQARPAMDQQQPQQQPQRMMMMANERPAAQMFVADQWGRRQLRLLPSGLLDETLLRKGSFSFGAKRVDFDKLRVLLGNVYARQVNGRPLRESYLLREPAKHAKRQQVDQPQETKASDHNKEPRDDSLRLHILS